MIKVSSFNELKSWVDDYRRDLVFPLGFPYYQRIIGTLRPVNIKAVLERRLGYKVKIAKPNARGIDVWIYDKNNLVAVMEVKNWKNTNEFKPNEIRDMENSLLKEDCDKYIVTSFGWQYKPDLIRNFIEENNLKTIAFGFQTQVPQWIKGIEFQCKEKNADIWDMKPNGLDLLATIEEILAPHFERIH
jgi:hypothetical protein